MRVQGPPAAPLVLPPTQRPAEQVWPAEQEMPQAPQLLASVLMSTHTEPHIRRGAVQVALQRPETQA